MRIAIPRETEAGEPRVAGTPDTVKRLKALGGDLVVEPGAGLASGILDSDFEAAGATIAADAVKGADVVLKVRRPSAAELKSYKPGAVVLATMDPYGNEAALAQMAAAGVAGFAMELMPRITRAQVDGRAVVRRPTSPATSAVIDAASEYRPRTADDDDRRRHGAGRQDLRHGRRRRRPAGDRHGAPPRRGCDRHRRASRRQGAGGKPRRQVRRRRWTTSSSRRRRPAGYAKPMSAEYQAKQAALVAEHIAKQDIVITTALIPGRAGAAARHERDGGLDEAGLGAGRPCRRARRQCRGRQGRRDRGHRQRRRRSSATPMCPAASPRPRPRSMPRTSSPSSRS